MRKWIIIALLLCAVAAMGQDFFRRSTPVAVAGAATEGPVYWWKLTEADTTYVADWSGNNNTGTISGAVLTNMSPYAFYFNTDDYIDTVTNSYISGTNRFTWTCWVKTTQRSTSPQTHLVGDYNHNDELNDSRTGIWLYDGDAYHIANLNNSTNVAADNITPARVSDNVWHFVAAGRNSTHTFVYIDGVLIGNTVVSGTAELTTTAFPPIRIGGPPYSDSSVTYLTGYLDDVRLYSRGLTSNEQFTIYGEGRQ